MELSTNSIDLETEPSKDDPLPHKQPQSKCHTMTIDADKLPKKLRKIKKKSLRRAVNIGNAKMLGLKPGLHQKTGEEIL